MPEQDGAGFESLSRIGGLEVVNHEQTVSLGGRSGILWNTVKILPLFFATAMSRSASAVSTVNGFSTTTTGKFSQKSSRNFELHTMFTSQKRSFCKFCVGVMLCTDNHKINIWIRKEIISSSIMLCIGVVHSTMFSCLGARFVARCLSAL